jgi:DNA-binding XRE family transcriptional regulator
MDTTCRLLFYQVAARGKLSLLKNIFRSLYSEIQEIPINLMKANQCNNLNNLRKYRRLRGLRQSDVADILGIKSTSMISRWEKGTCLPDSLNMLKMSIIYRTMVDALFIDLVIVLRERLLSKEEEVLKKAK